MKPSSWRHAVLAVIFGLLLSVSAHAQQDRISLNLNDAPLKQLFTEIERQTDWKFSYRDSEIENRTKVTIHVDSATLAEVLNMELSKAGLQYTTVGDKIVVTPKPAASDAVTVKGRVIDHEGLPVICGSAFL